MDGRLSDNRTACSFCKGTVGRHIADCLCHNDDRTVLFSDYHLGVRDLAASPAFEEPRQLQGMADLLAPFAGKRAPELARILRREFGSLGRALAAPSKQLIDAGREHAGICELLVAARRLVEETNRENLVGTQIEVSDPALLEYLRDRLCRGKRERLLVMFCNQNDEYLSDEEMGWGNLQNVRLDAGQLFRRALTLDACSMLLAHNHPSGDCTPSGEDIAATRRLADIGETLGLRFVDHLVLTRTKAYSMRAGASL